MSEIASCIAMMRHINEIHDCNDGWIFRISFSTPTDRFNTLVFLISSDAAPSVLYAFYDIFTLFYEQRDLLLFYLHCVSTTMLIYYDFASFATDSNNSQYHYKLLPFFPPKKRTNIPKQWSRGGLPGKSLRNQIKDRLHS